MKKNEKTSRGKNYLIFFLLLIVFLGVIYYFYQDNINNTIAEIGYPSEVVYDFESDVLGEHPVDWRGTSWSGTEVITWELDDIHGQVAEIENRDGKGVELAARYKKAESGIIEFDIYCEYTDKRIGIDITQLTEDYDHLDDIRINLGGSDGEINVKDGTDNYVKVKSFSSKQWYHFKIEFNMDYWELWIDDEHIQLYQELSEQGYYISYYEQPPYFCELYFSTYKDDNVFYVDNVEINVDAI